MTCRKGFVACLAHVRLLPAAMARPLVASGRSRACGKTCGSALPITSHRQTRIWQPTFLRGCRRSPCSRCLTCGPAISAGSAQRNTAVRKEDLRSKPTRRVSPPPRRTGPQGSVRCRLPAGGHVVLERAMHERVRSRRMDRRPVEVADTPIRASIRNGGVELAGELLGRSYEIAAGRCHRPTRSAQPGRPLLLSRRTAVLSS